MSKGIRVHSNGVMGGAVRCEKKGMVEITLSMHDFIKVDAFEGRGDSYKERETPLIEIRIGETLFVGTKEELEKQLKK